MNNIEAMTPVQPGAYVALYRRKETGEFHREDVVAVVAGRAPGGWIEFEALSVRGGYDLHVPDHNKPRLMESLFEYHGMFKPDEADAYIATKKAEKAAN
ncbi:hypothetical protein GCM10010215_40040 [Streptomyces virginiae]|uniref:Uncharacterized protein n=1 Tax=Streptomyces virginiae TaxID=1961 RepID=A0ABQ3NZK5_STRVG|nr:hypothetical protein [Streptomyces virginiae]MBP2343807.1 hypothetical protein [Streptomyces virginiae]GGQ10988.1 hypothetical protein GCM10010215_40040 [Streptomyces virginiae]GHI18199.1 hypothetical protein Scinn_76620 [Streptomyces virginiae]